MKFFVFIFNEKVKIWLSNKQPRTARGHLTIPCSLRTLWWLCWKKKWNRRQTTIEINLTLDCRYLAYRAHQTEVCCSANMSERQMRSPTLLMVQWRFKLRIEIGHGEGRMAIERNSGGFSEFGFLFLSSLRFVWNDSDWKNVVRIL